MIDRDRFSPDEEYDPVEIPDDVCLTCGGEGEVTVRDRSGDPQRERSARCPDCHGTGDCHLPPGDDLDAPERPPFDLSAGPSQGGAR